MAFRLALFVIVDDWDEHLTRHNLTEDIRQRHYVRSVLSVILRIIKVFIEPGPYCWRALPREERLRIRKNNRTYCDDVRCRSKNAVWEFARWHKLALASEEELL